MASTPRVPQPPRLPQVAPAAPTEPTVDRATGPGRTAEDGVTYFEGTVVKVDADGNDVLSDHLLPGETLRRETTDRYTAVRAAAPESDTK